MGVAVAASAKSLQLCPTLCDPIDGNPPGSPIPGILQARTLEWVVISFSNAWKWKVKVTLLSRVWLLATPWTAAYQAPLSMGFSRQEHWSGLSLPSQDGCWILSKTFFCIYWDNHMVFIFQFVNVVYNIDWFVNIEEFLHPWDKALLVMMYDLFNMLLDSVC